MVRDDGNSASPRPVEVESRDLFGHPTVPASEPGGEATARPFSREHLAIAQRISASGSAEIDLVSGQAIWTDELFRIAGRPIAAVAPSLASFIAQVHPEDRNWVLDSILREAGGRQVPSFEFRLVRPDGEVRWLRRHSALRFDAQGKAVTLVEVYHDLNERKLLETALHDSDEALRFSKKHLDLAQRVARVGSIVRDLRTRRVQWSDEMYRLLGYQPGEVEPSHERYMARVHPDDAAIVTASSDAAWAGRETPPVEYRLRLADGSVHWVRREAAVAQDERGEPILSVSTVVDITEQKRMETELRRSQEHLQRAQHVGMIGSSEVDLLHRDKSIWSEEYFRLLGLDPARAQPGFATFAGAILPEDRARLVSYEAMLAHQGPIEPIDIRVRGQDGGVRWLRRQIKVVNGTDGTPSSVLFTLQDVTESKRMEAALIASAEQLRRSREHLERAQRAAGVGSVEADLRTDTVVWSDEFYRLLGYRPGEVEPKRDNFFARVHPEDQEKMRSMRSVWATAEDVRSDEFRVLLPNGQVRWLVRRAETERDGEGNPIRALRIYRDVTDRRHMELAMIAYADEVRTSREHLLRAQRAGGIGSTEIDLRTGGQFWSEELYRILGLDRSVEPSTEAFAAAIHPGDRDRVRAWGRQLLSGMTVEPATFRILRADGELRLVYRVSEFVRDSAGVPVSIVSTLTDVTEVRRAEEERAKLQEHLAHAQKLDSLGALSGGIAHDFNNLLTAILGGAALLEDDGSLPAAARKLAHSVVRAAEQGAGLTRRLLSFGRRQMLSPVVIDLATVAHELDGMLRRTLGEHIAIEMRQAPDLWMVKADRSQIEAAVVNLSINARDAMAGGGTLTIEMSNRIIDDPGLAERGGAAVGEYVAIAVTDTGSGMSPEVLERAFEPFFTTKEEGQGTGLGLAMVYGFAKQSGGSATIESVLGKGTCVTLLLPRSTERVAAAVAPGRSDRSIGGNECILLVEDDEAVRDFIATALERMGYRVASVRDGHEALRAFDDGTADIELLLTDLMLPGGMNGRELAEEAARRRPGLRVLFASGYTEDTLIRDGKLQPGQLLIPKPFNSQELARKVRQALDG